jgi:Flp pilus assembly CpaE family ATPase
VIDVPRGDHSVLDSLDLVTSVVVVANQELATVRNAGRMAASLRSRYPKAKVTTVINRTDRRSEIGHRDIERAVGGTITHQFPSDYRRALGAMHKGRPLALDNHNDLSASFTALARELAGVSHEAESSSGRRGFLSGRR